MGTSDVLSVKASCLGSVLKSASVHHSSNQLQNQSAPCSPVRCTLPAGLKHQRVVYGSELEKRGTLCGTRPRQNVAANNSNGKSWPSSNIVLVEAESEAATQDVEALEVDLVEEGGIVEEQGAIEWVGGPSIHQEFDELLAAHGKNGGVGSKSGREGAHAPAATSQAARSWNSLSSLQPEKQLGTGTGLLGFEKIGRQECESSQAGTQEARFRMDGSSESPVDNMSKEPGVSGVPVEAKKGGTRVIRPKGRGEATRFEAFLSQRAPGFELPSSEPIPIIEFSLPGTYASTTPGKTQDGEANLQVGAARGLAGDQIQNQEVSKQTRQELSQQITGFTSRLFKAVSSSGSHRDIWPRFLDPKQPEPQNPKSVTKPVLAPATLDAIAGSVGQPNAGQPTESKEARRRRFPTYEPQMGSVGPDTEKEGNAVGSGRGSPLAEARAEEDQRLGIDGTLGEERPAQIDHSAVREEGMDVGNGLYVEESEQESGPKRAGIGDEIAIAGEGLWREGEPDSASQDGMAPSSAVEEVKAEPIADMGSQVRESDSRTGGEDSRPAEPSFPHWLVGPGSRDSLLMGAEATAARIWESAELGRRGEHVSSEEGEGQQGLASERVAVDRASDSREPQGVRADASGGDGNVSARASVPLDLRTAREAELADSGVDSRLRRDSLITTTREPQSAQGRPPADLRAVPESNPTSQGSTDVAADTIQSESRGFEAVGAVWGGESRQGLVDLVSRTDSEDPDATPEEAPSLKLEYPEYPTFTEIVEGDKRAVASALAYSRWWLRSWRVPLQYVYNPEMVNDYFARRPHLLLGRLFQIATAALVAGAPLLPELARARTIGAADAIDRREMLERRAAVQQAAMRLKTELVGLGPTFVKAAQSLSSRPDIVGEDTAGVLAELQDRLPPFSSAAAMQVIEQELGRPAHEVFLELSETPVAAASFGQVYKGRTREGETVAVKVQRPGVLASVALDIHILRVLLQGVRRVARVNSDLRLLADELGRGLYGELDYRAEAANAELFASSQQHLPFVTVPRVLHQYTSRRVLTMEWIEGDRPVDLLAAADAGSSSTRPSTAMEAQRKLLSLVSMGIESSLVQLLETGVMHSDPHPGNLLLRPDGKLAYLDFGLMTHITPQHRGAMLAAIAHLVNAEWAALTDDLDALDVLKPTNDRSEVARALAEAFAGGPEPLVTGAGVPRVRFGQVATKLWGLAVRFRFKLPPYFTLVLRNLASLEGIGLTVDPSFKVFASAYPHVIRRLLTENAPFTRRVLRTLLTDGERGVRWDRMAALAGSFLGGTSSTGPNSSTSSNGGGSQYLPTRAARVVLGRKGAGVRRVLLEMDLVRFVRGFSSLSAAPLRVLLVTAAAQFIEQTLFGPPKQNVLGSPQVAASLQPTGATSSSFRNASESGLGLVPDVRLTSAAVVVSFVVFEPASRRGDKAVPPNVEKRLLRKRAWLLLKLIAARLPTKPAERAGVFWAGLRFAFAVMRSLVARAWSRLVATVQGLAAGARLNWRQQ